MSPPLLSRHELESSASQSSLCQPVAQLLRVLPGPTHKDALLPVRREDGASEMKLSPRLWPPPLSEGRDGEGIATPELLQEDSLGRDRIPHPWIINLGEQGKGPGVVAAAMDGECRLARSREKLAQRKPLTHVLLQSQAADPRSSQDGGVVEGLVQNLTDPGIHVPSDGAKHQIGPQSSKLSFPSAAAGADHSSPGKCIQPP